MLDYNKIRIKFTKHNSGRQKVTNIYTIIEGQALKNNMRYTEDKFQSNITQE